MPGKWTAEDDVVLLLAVIKECNCKPNWPNIVTAMGNKFTAEGIRQHYAKVVKGQTSSTAGVAFSSGAPVKGIGGRRKSTTTGTPTKKRKTGMKSARAKEPEDSDPEESAEYDEDDEEEEGEIRGKGKGKGKGKVKKEDVEEEMDEGEA